MEVNKSIKRLQKQADVWRQDALTAPSAYILYTYMELDETPEWFQERLDPEAKKVWDEQSSFEHIEANIEQLIEAIFTSLSKKKVAEAFLLIPIILAHLFVMNKGTGALEGKYRKAFNEFAETSAIDRPLAEIVGMFDLSDLMTEVAKKINIKLTYNIEEVVTRIIEEQGLDNAQSFGATLSDKAIGDIVDKALADYEEEHGESALKDVEEGADLEPVLEALREEVKHVS